MPSIKIIFFIFALLITQSANASSCLRAIMGLNGEVHVTSLDRQAIIGRLGRIFIQNENHLKSVTLSFCAGHPTILKGRLSMPGIDQIPVASAF